MSVLKTPFSQFVIQKKDISDDLLLLFLLYLQRKKMKSVVTIRLPDEYRGMLDNIKLELGERGIDVKDNVLLKTVLLTGIRDINRMITLGINVFDGRNEDTED